MSNDDYTIIIGLCVLISGGIGFIESSKFFWIKLGVYVVVCMIAIWATVKKEDLSERNSFNDKIKAKRESDSLRNEDRIYFERIDARKEERANSRIEDYKSEVNRLLAGRNIKLDNLPPINSINIKPTNVGVMLSYYLSKKITNLKLVSVLKSPDPTFDDSFGEKLIARLPGELGYHSVSITSKEVSDVQNLRFRIQGEFPYLNTPTFETGMTVDDTAITTDNAVITVDK